MFMDIEERKNFLNFVYEKHTEDGDNDEIKNLYINAMEEDLIGSNRIKGIEKRWGRIQLERDTQLGIMYEFDLIELFNLVKGKSKKLLEDLRAQKESIT